ncbi:MAG: hypothetical protein QGF59_30485, partial [Pirellulaceae bacterium]|nr:hypothetical protein [Pirellulaceae bacterium]
MTIKITICENDEHVANQYPEIASDELGNTHEDLIATFISEIDEALYSTLFDAVSPDYDAFEIRSDSSFQNWNGGKYQRDKYPPLIMSDIIYVATTTDADAELLRGLADDINRKLEAVCKTAESRMLSSAACFVIDEAGISRRE